MKSLLTPGMLLAAASLVFALQACTYASEEELRPAPAPCDTASLRYAADIAPIFDSYGCTGCHAAPAGNAGITLDSYAGLKNVVDNQRTRLLGALKHQPGFATMPDENDPSVKVQDAEVARIERWINACAPE